MTRIAILLVGLFIILTSPVSSSTQPNDESWSPDQLLQNEEKQETPPGVLLFPTIAECGTDEQMYHLAKSFGEIPFSISTGMIYSQSLGQIVEGKTITTVNPDTKTWTIFWTQDVGVVCIIASGSNFFFIFDKEEKGISL